MMDNIKIQAIDFFCGAGGLTKGLLKAGIEVKAGIDIDSHCKYPYEYNNKVPFLEKDISKLSFDDIKDFIDPNAKLLLAGCAPCQPFSSHANKHKKNESNDKR